MEYKVDNNIITITDASQFNPQHILECGQIFRYQKLNANDYVVFSKDKKAVIQKTKTGYQIISNYPDYFVNFFDLDADYNTIKQQLNSMANIMPKATNYGYGIRILNQQPLETIMNACVSFVAQIWVIFMHFQLYNNYKSLLSKILLIWALGLEQNTCLTP